MTVIINPLPLGVMGSKVHPFSDQTSAKTLPDGAAHTYIGYIRENKSAGPASKILHFVSITDSFIV